MMGGNTEGGTCGCMHHKMPGIFLVLFGLLFLGGTFGWWGENIINIGWPTLVILAGLTHYTKEWCKCC